MSKSDVPGGERIESSPRTVTRRSVVKGLGGAAVVGATGLGVLGLSNTPARAAVAVDGITAEDVSITSSDGEVTSLTVHPDVTATWDGLAEPIGGILHEAYVKLSSEDDVDFQLLDTGETRTASASTSGSLDLDIPVLSLLGAPKIDPAVLADTTDDGVAVDTSIDLMLGVGFVAESSYDGSGGDPDLVPIPGGNDRDGLLKRSSFTVSVSKDADSTTTASVSTGGVWNTGGY